MIKSKFVLMKHQAKKAGLHYDLRFKIPGKNDWDSYVIRKNIPTGSEKRMVIRTTIHSEKEALLTGKIETGYGAGILTKEDYGDCEILLYKPGKHIAINFKGSKLKGIYHFINMAKIGRGKGKQYLFFKGKL